MVQAQHLNNFWKIKDVCQGICSELNFLTDDEEDLDSVQRQIIQDDYKQVKGYIDQITATGYFNKCKVEDEQNVITLVNNIINVENKNKNLTASVWKKQLSDVKKFNTQNFKICVKPFFRAQDFDNMQECIFKQQNFITTHLISNKNIKLYNPYAEFGGKTNILPFGVVYDVNESNFIAACDQTSMVSIKTLNEITDRDFVATANKNNQYLFINGYATKLKTPNQIIKKYANERFETNDNVVILDGESSKPSALFYYSFGIDKVNPIAIKLKELSLKLNIPLLEIDLNVFFAQNGKFIPSNSIARSSLNYMVDCFNQALIDFCGVDALKLSKKLVGFNTNLRYNFVYKFIFAIKKHINNNLNISEQELKDFITRAIAKSIAKKNLLTHEREEQNGAPLMYPDEQTFIAVPKEFLTE